MLYNIFKNKLLPQFETAFENISEKYEPIYSSDPHNISCFVNKSSAIGCTYDWTITKGKEVLKIEGIQNLSKEHLLVAGNYQCIASCHFVNGGVYAFRGTHFEFVDDSNTISGWFAKF